MVRGLIGGVVSGVIVAGAGLGALSVLLPPPQTTAPAVTSNQTSNEAVPTQGGVPKGASVDPTPPAQSTPTEPAQSEAAPTESTAVQAGSGPEATQPQTPAPATQPEGETQPSPLAAITPAPQALSPVPEGAPEIMLLPDGSVVPQEKQMPRVFSAGNGEAGLSNAPGTVVNRLAAIGRGSVGAGSGAAPAGDPPASGPRQDALRTYGAAVSGISGRPLMSILLRDVGVAAGGLDPQTIASLKVPVTVVIDPTLPEASDNARLYRASGHEVAILATGIPDGATAQDVATAMEAWHHALPEAIGVVEAPAPVFQNNRLLAQQVVAEVKQSGAGLITQPIGLDSASQIAKAEGVPQAQLWKVLDAGRESSADISRSLDRAAFEGERKGGIAVMLSAWPESVAGLIDWASNPPGKIALAPASALALRDKK